MNLEDDLRRALRREPAPPDFAARVLRKTRVIPFWRRPVTFAIAAGLAVMSLVPPAVYEYQRQRRAVEARNQLILALAITRVQLEHVKEQIRRNTRHKI
jgi:hypothetical protein